MSDGKEGAGRRGASAAVYVDASSIAGEIGPTRFPIPDTTHAGAAG